MRFRQQPGNMLSMNADLPDYSENTQLLHNLIRSGTVVQIAGGRARVRLSPKLTTAWLRWVTHRAGDARTWWSPSVGGADCSLVARR
jgi:phage baseplate assembly protein V